MDDKPVVGLVTAAVIARVVALCCLGPGVVGSLLGGVVGWLGGLGPEDVVGAAVAAGFVAYALRRWHRGRLRREGMQQRCGQAGPGCGHDGSSEAPPPRTHGASRGKM